MKAIYHIAFSAVLFFGFSCQSQSNPTENKNEKDLLPGDTYVSAFGEVRLNQLNDTTYETFFLNNEGHAFDTIMYVAKDSVFGQIVEGDGNFLLAYNWGGLIVRDNSIQVFDFAGYGMLGSQTMMWEMYTKPFYKTNSKFSFKGDLIGGKGLWSINEVYLLDSDLENDNYYELEGIIKREKWPTAYYSTDESPQGIFGNDTSKNHHRLILTEIKNVTPEPYKYRGSTINISTGEAAIAWEFADSEAYILDEHEPWTKEEELKDIIVEGILIQNEKGSVLKNWRIISE